MPTYRITVTRGVVYATVTLEIIIALAIGLA